MALLIDCVLVQLQYYKVWAINWVKKYVSTEEEATQQLRLLNGRQNMPVDYSALTDKGFEMKRLSHDRFLLSEAIAADILVLPGCIKAAQALEIAKTYGKL